MAAQDAQVKSTADDLSAVRDSLARAGEENRNLTQTLAETTAQAKQTAEKLDDMTSRLDDLDEKYQLLRRTVRGNGHGLLIMRYTAVGEPDFAAQLYPMQKIQTGSSRDFNQRVASVLDGLSRMNITFDEFYIQGMNPGSSQLRELESGLRSRFPGIRISTITEEGFPGSFFLSAYFPGETPLFAAGGKGRDSFADPA